LYDVLRDANIVSPLVKLPERIDADSNMLKNISTEAFGFPREEAVGVALDSLKHFIDDWGEARLKDVSFVVFGEGSSDGEVYVRRFG